MNVSVVKALAVQRAGSVPVPSPSTGTLSRLLHVLHSAIAAPDATSTPLSSLGQIEDIILCKDEDTCKTTVVSPPYLKSTKIPIS